MRPDKLYLTDIVEAADAIAKFLTNTTRDEFMIDELRQSAILQKLAVVGEAAARVSKDFQQAHPEIEWRQIIAFRNVVIHAYFSISLSIVWVTATQDAPELREKIVSVLQKEF